MMAYAQSRARQFDGGGAGVELISAGLGDEKQTGEFGLERGMNQRMDRFAGFQAEIGRGGGDAQRYGGILEPRDQTWNKLLQSGK